MMQSAHNKSAVDDQHYSPHQQPSSSVLDPFAGRLMSMDDSNLANARTTRIAQAEAAIRQDMFKDCTFKPVITPLPRSYGHGGKENTPFYTRVMRWQKDKEMEAKRRAEMHAANDVTDCTFNPQINRHSEKAAAEHRAQLNKHGGAAAAVAGAGSGDANNASSVSIGRETANERLYRSREILEMQKRISAEEHLKAQEQAERNNTEYRVHGTHNPRYAHIAPRVYNNLLDAQDGDSGGESPSLNQSRSRHATPSKDPNCSFTPKVKGASSNMSSARLYLSAHVVDRLTKPIITQQQQQQQGGYGYGRPSSASRANNRSAFENSTAGGGAHGNSSSSTGGGAVMDVASFMGSLAAGAYNTPGAHPRQRPQSAPKERHGAGADDSVSFTTLGSTNAAAAASVVAAEKAARLEKFKQFLERQRQSLKKKSFHVEETARATTPVFKPELCQQSLVITENHFKGTFLERVRRDVSNRAAKESRIRADRASGLGKDAQCTFKPQILRRSEALRPRGITEMSKRDQLKRESNRKVARLRSEQEQLAEATFHPVISRYAERNGVESRLGLKKDPQEFLEQYKRDCELKAAKREEAMKTKEEADRSQCTFKPQTSTCPAYIKRIAKSMQAVKASRRQSTGSVNSGSGSMANRPPSTWR